MGSLFRKVKRRHDVTIRRPFCLFNLVIGSTHKADLVYNKTELHIDMDVDEQYQEMFEKMWSAALESLKELSER